MTGSSLRCERSSAATTRSPPEPLELQWSSHRIGKSGAHGFRRCANQWRPFERLGHRSRWRRSSAAGGPVLTHHCVWSVRGAGDAWLGLCKPRPVVRCLLLSLVHPYGGLVTTKRCSMSLEQAEGDTSGEILTQSAHHVAYSRPLGLAIVRSRQVGANAERPPKLFRSGTLLLLAGAAGWKCRGAEVPGAEAPGAALPAAWLPGVRIPVGSARAGSARGRCPCRCGATTGIGRGDGLIGR